jgi:hypothetical protein
MKLSRDPDFLADAEKSQLLVNLSSGAAVQRIASMIAAAPNDVVQRLVRILSGSPQ